MIYLDNHRLTAKTSKVKDVLKKEINFDPSSPYFLESAFVAEVESGLKNLYDLVGAAPNMRFEVTSGEEDAARKVFFKVYKEVIYETGKNFILAPVTENASIRNAIDEYEDLGCVGRYLPVNEEGQITKEILEKHYTPKAGLLALSWACPLTGVIQPMEEIAEFCKKKGIVLYVGGSEMLAKLFMRLEEMHISYFSFSSDLFHGPKGMGGLFIRESMNRFDLSKVKNPEALLGMCVAASEVLDFMDGMNTETAFLRNLFEDTLKKEIPEIVFFSTSSKRLPNISAFAIENVHSEYLTYLLAERKVFITYGGGRVQKLEHILNERGVENKLSKSAVSISLSMHTTEEEIKKAINSIIEVRNLSKRVSLEWK
jgi:cysteine desulfurase